MKRLRNDWMSMEEGIEGPREGSPKMARKISWSLGGYNRQKIMKSLRNQGHSAGEELTDLLSGLLITELN